MAKLVSKTYGDALFAVAKEENRIDEFYEEAKAMQEVLQTNAELNKLMDHPKIVKEEKVKVLEDVFAGRVSKEIIGLLNLLIIKGHYKDVQAVFEYFITLVKEEKRIGVAYVTTALELLKDQRKSVEARLLETTSYKSFEMHYDTDPSLIGGMVIRIGDRIVDSSIKTKLFDLSRNLKSIQI